MVKYNTRKQRKQRKQKQKCGASFEEFLAGLPELKEKCEKLKEIAEEISQILPEPDEEIDDTIEGMDDVIKDIDTLTDMNETYGGLTKIYKYYEERRDTIKGYYEDNKNTSINLSGLKNALNALGEGSYNSNNA